MTIIGLSQYYFSSIKCIDFDKMRLDTRKYETELARWKTAVKKVLNDKDSTIAYKHLYCWGPEDDKPDEKYKDLPINGVPRDKAGVVALVKTGRLGAATKRTGLKIDDDDD